MILENNKEYGHEIFKADCPTCEYRLQWAYDGDGEGHLVAICCGKHYWASPSTYSLDISELEEE